MHEKNTRINIVHTLMYMYIHIQNIYKKSFLRYEIYIIYIEREREYCTFLILYDKFSDSTVLNQIAKI